MAILSDPLTAIFEFGSKVLDKFIADPQAKAQAQIDLFKMRQTGELAQLAAETSLATGQNEVNKIEAASTRLFVAGWRPFIGWVCGLAFMFKYIGGPLLGMLFEASGHAVKIPDMGFDELMPVLLGMLGLGGMRTYEKVKLAADTKV